ncbi:hypothetical protein GCM10023263_29940 [Phytohabitans rumicis]
MYGWLPQFAISTRMARSPAAASTGPAVSATPGAGHAAFPLVVGAGGVGVGAGSSVQAASRTSAAVAATTR